jgi:uncharacterized protein with ParB-like and HNH nuclease domain
MNTRLIYSIKELFGNYLTVGKRFIIPEYQRGYKWDNSQIVQLLNDINHFEYVEGTDMFYCLQNITVVKTEEDNYNVVDGQQRLTTLVLLLSFLEETPLITHKIYYNVREASNVFIQEYIIGPGKRSSIIKDFEWDRSLGKNDNWSKFVKLVNSDGAIDFDHQDIYYMFNAYSTIKRWMNDQGIDMEQFKSKLLNYVKVIVNAPKTKDEQTLFNNLNTGQVHLDGADLVRAIIITRLPQVKYNNIGDDEREIILLNENRVKIGMELDRINSWWTDKKGYYRSVIKTVKSQKADSIVFNESIYHIDNLYKLYVLANGDTEISIEYFEGKASHIEDFYKGLIQLQRTLEDWYEDNVLYHLVFYVLNHVSKDFKTIYYKWLDKATTRESFISFLKKRITDEFNSWENYSILGSNANASSDEDKHYFEENWYEGTDELTKVLILVDIIDSIDDKESMGKISRLPIEAMVKKKEDEKEHIFPQTPRSNKPKDNNVAEIKAYVDYINCIEHQNTSPMPDLVFNENEAKNWNEEDWSIKKAEINERIKRIIPINALGNMCLLDKSINAAYGNDFFAVKHLKLMQKAKEGIYIRPHVMDAFCKTFANNKENDINYMKSWGKSDIINREKYIINQIKTFLGGSSHE